MYLYDDCVSSEQSRSQFYTYRMLLPLLLLLLLCVAAAVVLLLPAAVRHCVPEGQIGCWFIESDLSVFFLFIQTGYIFNVPLGGTVAFTASICQYPR